jgi:hypothetical protein
MEWDQRAIRDAEKLDRAARKRVATDEDPRRFRRPGQPKKADAATQANDPSKLVFRSLENLERDGA